MDFLALLNDCLGIFGFETYSNMKRRLYDIVPMCGYENSHIIRNFSQFWHKICELSCPSANEKLYCNLRFMLEYVSSDRQS